MSRPWKLHKFSKHYMPIFFVFNALSPFIYAQQESNTQESATNKSQNQTSTSSSNDNSSAKSYKLNAVTTTSNIQLHKYGSDSGGGVSKGTIETSPSGNGDITSILRILPNVQFNNTQMRSATPGEIDPANISVSGGVFYQNNFQLDGFNMNNDLDPNGGTTNGPNALRGGRSQGLAVDTSLLDSITVQDSNISASYGGFTGGVIQANVRKPRRDGGMLGTWHSNVSYQYTSNYFTTYFIDEGQMEDFIQSSNENYQPNFVKHILRANVEGWITQDFGLIASYSTTRSYIPLKAYSFTVGEDVNTTRDQHRIIDNYYIKANYNPLESLSLEANIAYMPQDNTYYNAVAKDSFYAMKSGGVQSGLKAIWDNNYGSLTSTLGYNFLQNSRDSEKNYFMAWKNSESKNWAATNATNRVSNEGGYGDMEQIQNTLNYKSDFALSSLNWGESIHKIKSGVELNYTHAYRNRLDPYYAFSTPQKLNSGESCRTDSKFDFETCDTTKAVASGFDHGQYFNKVTESKAGEFAFGTLAFGVYVEDDMKFDLGTFGLLNFRPGVRLDADDYMGKVTVAPRFSLSYDAPWSDRNRMLKTSFITGLNKYYGRNLLSYRLYNFISNNTVEWTRSSATSEWTAGTNKDGDSDYATFSGLNVPYVDEVVLGVNQNLYMFDLNAKYIYRGGRDEIMLTTKNKLDTWTNDGNSQSHIISLSVKNSNVIETFGMRHYYLLAFDYTHVKRSYNLYSADEAYVDNNDVIYNGEMIKYRDRPTENFLRPYTLRANLTHTYDIYKTKILLNNFFRLRGGYEAMVLLSKTDNNYDTSHPDLLQYGKTYFDPAFTWDMRIGVEVDVWNKNVLYVNLDIYNVLNTKNKTALTTASTGAVITGISSSSSVVAYEIGRQFWLQVGYKF